MTDTQPEAPAEPTLADEIVAELSRLRAARDAAGAERDRLEAERRAVRRQAAEMFHAGELSPHDISRIASTDFQPDEGLITDTWSDPFKESPHEHQHRRQRG
jgi:hypothetical protein